MISSFTNLVHQDSSCLIFHNIHEIGRVQETWIIVVYIAECDSHVGNVIFICLEESSTIVRNDIELKCFDTFVVQIFGCCDSSIGIYFKANKTRVPRSVYVNENSFEREMTSLKICV